MNQEKELLEKVKEQYAKERGSESFDRLIYSIASLPTFIDEAYNVVSTRYANELLKQELNELWEKFDETGYHSCANHVLGKIQKLDKLTK